MNRRCTWEFSIEIVTLVEFGIWLIELIIITFVVDFLATSDLEIGIRERADISLSEIETFNNIDTNYSTSLGQHQAREFIFVTYFDHVLSQVKMSNIHLFHHSNKFRSSLGCFKLREIKCHHFIVILLIDFSN